MKTKLTERHYQVIEKDESGLIPAWVDHIVYNPEGILTADKGAYKFGFFPKHPKNYSPLPSRSDRISWKHIHEEINKDGERQFPKFTPEEVLRILSMLEFSLVDSK
ncbi:hypothetical protein J4463_00715 [Candidatus Pacearchaeota archaeon]|nr:hypothetical protein [Candidatus Pacearchaeota archaeon]